MNYISGLPKWVKITGTTALTLLVLYLLFRDKVDTYLMAKTGNLDPAAADDQEKVLKRGSRGPEVAQLQRYLKAQGYGELLGETGPAGDGVDGIFGPKTESALMAAHSIKQVSLRQLNELVNAENPQPRPTEMA